MIKYSPLNYKEINADNENIFGYIGFDTDKKTECGKCVALIDGYMMKILSLDFDSDSETAEGFIRSTLNYGANRNAYIAYYCAQNGIEVAKTLGFTENNDGILYGEIPELLKGSCCKSK